MCKPLFTANISSRSPLFTLFCSTFSISVNNMEFEEGWKQAEVRSWKPTSRERPCYQH